MSRPRFPDDARPVRRGLTLFRIAGTEVRIDVSWAILFALVLVSLGAGFLPSMHPGASTPAVWAAAVVATVGFFASIVAHELAHTLVAKRAGIEVPSITLFLFGGVSQIADEPRDARTELRVAVVGPLASFALAAAFASLHAAMAGLATPLAAGVTLYLAWINTALGVFNLLPGLPLDGGRILRALAWWRTGSLRRSTRVASSAGKGIAVGLMVLGGLEIFSGALVGGLWLILIGLFLRGTAEAGYQNLVLVQSLADVSVGDVAIADPVGVAPQLSLDDLAEHYFLRHGYRAYPVLDGETPVGIVAVTALRDLDREERTAMTVKDRMTPIDDALCIGPQAPLTDALKQLARTRSGRLLVVHDDRLVGLLTKDAVARFLEIRRVLEPARGEDAGARA